jgi:septal ring factor EnvC (AmiA/AmiB activator)
MLLSLRRPRRIAVSAIVASLFLAPGLCLAQATELDAIRALVKNLEQQLQKALSRIDQLEKEKAADSARVGQVEKSVRAVQSAPSALNPAIGMAIDATAEHRAKAGGTFNFRAAEVGIAASIDPYARGYAFITGSKEGV